jgi:hypothetical protein
MPRFTCRNFGRCAVMASCILLTAPRAHSQTAAAGQLKIKILKGDNETHLPTDRAGKPLEVEVRNDVDLPQPDAQVSFAVKPDSAPVWLVKDKAKKPLDIKVTADDQGIARIENIHGLKPRGPVQISVKAAFAGKEGMSTINQVVDRGPWLTRKRATILGAVLATTGIVLYEVFKAGPPTASIGAPTSTTGPQVVALPQIRIGR